MSEDDFNRRNIAEFRDNHGRVGGQFEGAPCCPAQHGAPSGKPRDPHDDLADGDRYLVFASEAGGTPARTGTSTCSPTPMPASRSGTSNRCLRN